MPEKSKKENWEISSAPKPFDTEEFSSLWLSLLSMPKWRKKPLSAIQMACTRLKRYDVRFACTLVENAIEGNYQGVVFSDTNLKYENWKRQNLTNGSKNTSVAGKTIEFDRL